MKKILLACLCLCSSALWASSDRVIFQITNAGATDCVLTNQTIFYGHVSDRTTIPDVLFRDQTVTFSMRSEPYRFHTHQEKSILLTYTCGDEQEITLFTDVYPLQGTFGIRTRVIDVKHVIATFKPTYYGKHDSHALKAHWTIG